MEWEHGTEHTEANESHREEEVLPAEVDRVVFGDLENVPCERAAFGGRMIVDADEAEHQER